MQAFLPQCFATPECSGKPVPRLFEGDHAFVNTVFLMRSLVVLKCFIQLVHFIPYFVDCIKTWLNPGNGSMFLSRVNCEVNPHNSALEVPA